MSHTKETGSYFSDVCVERCGGLCCDPWWGIISFPLVRHGGAVGLKQELIKAIRSRTQRITESYVTNETPKRRLFKEPYRYGVRLRGIRAEGAVLHIDILLMLAFRCLFFSEEKSCSIHPSVLGGLDIRPPHCGHLGVTDAIPGQKGYCRVVHAAASGADEVDLAISLEKQTVGRHLSEGFDTTELAADALMNEINAYLSTHAPHLSAAGAERSPTLGRNDPCWCGSTKKFKKCHGA